MIASLSISLGHLLAGGLLVAAALVALALQRLGLARTMLVQSLRGLVQLLAIGGVLHLLADSRSMFGLLCTIVAMTAFASHHATRAVRPLPLIRTIAITAIGATLVGVTAILGFAVLRIDPLEHPAWTVALVGMVLANAMSGFQLFADAFARNVYADRDEVEVKLGLGADIRRAVDGPMRNALRTAMLPVGNLLAVIGIVQIPGIMAGQLFADATPLAAMRFGILMLEAAIASVLFAALLGAFFAHRLFFTSALQLKEDARDAA